MSWFKPSGHRQSPNRVRPPFEPASAAQKDIFLKAYAEEFNISVARARSTMSWAQYRHAMADDEAFLHAHTEINDHFIDKLEVVAYEMGMKSDAVMVKFLLERLRPEKYGNKSKVDVTHRVADPKDLEEMSDEDFAALCEQRSIGVEAS